MNELPRAFHSSPSAYLAMWRRLCTVLGALIIAATVVGQIRGQRFPAHEDLAISFSLPFVAYLLLAGLTYVSCSLFPVRLGPQGLKGWSLIGLPRFVAWDQIRVADVREIQGIPYIFVEAEGRLQPITIPVWLRQPERFVDAVREYAGPLNPLTLLVCDSGDDRDT